MDVAIRSGGPADIEPVVRVWQVANTARRGGRPMPRENEARVRAYLSKPDAFLLVADVSGEVVGLALGMRDPTDDGDASPVSGVCYVPMVYVAPGCWGRGIGGRIVDGVLAEAHKQVTDGSGCGRKPTTSARNASTKGADSFALAGRRRICVSMSVACSTNERCKLLPKLNDHPPQPLGVPLLPSLPDAVRGAQRPKTGTRGSPPARSARTSPDLRAAIGAVDGDFICDPGRLGLDVILPVFFLALLAEELRAGMRAVVVALIAALLALALVPFTTPACRWFGPLFDTGDRSERVRSQETRRARSLPRGRAGALPDGNVPRF